MNIFNPNSRQMSEEFANLLKYFSDDVEAALKKVYEKVEGISPAEIYALRMALTDTFVTNILIMSLDLFI